MKRSKEKQIHSALQAHDSHIVLVIDYLADASKTFTAMTSLDPCQAPHLCTSLISKASWHLIKAYLPYCMLYNLELPLNQKNITSITSLSSETPAIYH